MKIKPYIEKLGGSQAYKEFSSKYPDSFLVAGFFVLDLEEGKNIHQIDYYIPKEKKIAAFNLDNKVAFQVLEMMNNKIIPEKLDIQTNIDLDALEGILEDEMKNRNITQDIKKIIAVLQNVKGKKIWNLNCVLSGMEILKAHIDDDSKTVLKMEKTSLMDIMKKIPGNKMMGIPPKKEGSDGSEEGEESADEAQKKLKNLEKVEAQIEEAKEKIRKELAAVKEKKN